VREPGIQRHIAVRYLMMPALLGLFVLLSGCGSGSNSPISGTGFSRGEFCRTAVAPNYLLATKQMAPIHRVPKIKPLPYGPQNLVFRLFGSHVLYPARSIWPGGRFGYQLRLPANPLQSVHLGWTVSTVLSSVDRRGSVLRRIEHQDSHIEELRPSHERQFEIRGYLPVGFYRFDITIDPEDRPSIQFSEYLRVMYPRFDTKLRLSGSRVRAGENIYAQLVNTGTSLIAYGSEYMVQRLDHGRWIGVVLEEHGAEIGWSRVLTFTGPGGRDDCTKLPLSPNFPSGRYRVVKGVIPKLVKHGGHQVRLIADFRIVTSN
jgi:hypothetical protein